MQKYWLQAIVALATEYRRYGNPRITALLHAEGCVCNYKHIELIWRAEGLRVPAWQSKHGRLWSDGGSCLRLRPQHANHVRAYDCSSACPDPSARDSFWVRFAPRRAFRSLHERTYPG